MHVMTLNIDTLSRSWPISSGLVMSFLESTLRDWNVRLEPIAVTKPIQLNEACGTVGLAGKAIL